MVYCDKPVTAILVVVPPNTANPWYPLTKLVKVDEVDTSKRYPSAPFTAAQFAVNPVGLINVAALETGIEIQVVAEPFNGLSVKYLIVPHEVFPLYGYT